MAMSRVAFLLFFVPLAQAKVVEISEENWEQVLEGEWMLKFFAPWCPACRQMTDTWIEFAKLTTVLNLDGVGEIDVTKSPGLSGRFLITSLPTIFHVKDGEFRQYSGKRDKDIMVDYVEGMKWQETEVLPSWKHPQTPQMTVVATFFQLSTSLRNIHSVLTEQYDLPSWSVYLAFALATVLVGALLGLLLVFCIDCLLPMLVFNKRSSLESKMPKAKDSDDEAEPEGQEGKEDSGAKKQHDSSDASLRKRSHKPS